MDKSIVSPFFDSRCNRNPQFHVGFLYGTLPRVDFGSDRWVSTELDIKGHRTGLTAYCAVKA